MDKPIRCPVYPFDKYISDEFRQVSVFPLPGLSQRQVIV